MDKAIEKSKEVLNEMNLKDRFPINPNPIPGVPPSQLPILGEAALPKVPILDFKFQITPEMKDRLEHYKGELPLEGVSLINLVLELGICALDSMLQNENEKGGKTSEGTSQGTDLGCEAN